MDRRRPETKLQTLHELPDAPRRTCLRLSTILEIQVLKAKDYQAPLPITGATHHYHHRRDGEDADPTPFLTKHAFL
jgi:hypothetical protein